jgi:hypothetical protein
MLDSLRAVELDKAGASYRMHRFPGRVRNEMEVKPGHGEPTRSDNVIPRAV